MYPVMNLQRTNKPKTGQVEFLSSIAAAPLLAQELLKPMAAMALTLYVVAVAVVVVQALLLVVLALLVREKMAEPDTTKVQTEQVVVVVVLDKWAEMAPEMSVAPVETELFGLLVLATTTEAVAAVQPIRTLLPPMREVLVVEEEAHLVATTRQRFLELQTLVVVVGGLLMVQAPNLEMAAPVS